MLRTKGFGLKQTTFWAKADDLTEADYPKKNDFLTQSRRSHFFYYFIYKRNVTILEYTLDQGAFWDMVGVVYVGFKGAFWI